MTEPIGEVYRYGKDSKGIQWHGVHWYGQAVDLPAGTKLYTQPQKVEAPTKPEFLLNGTRFKLSFQEVECDECGHSTGEFVCRPLDQYHELEGAWVALVPAENDRHLSMKVAAPTMLEPVAEVENSNVMISEDALYRSTVISAERLSVGAELFALPPDAAAIIAARDAEIIDGAKDRLRLIETIKYLRGIAEHGEGHQCGDGETVESFVLGYVKKLESEVERLTREVSKYQHAGVSLNARKVEIKVLQEQLAAAQKDSAIIKLLDSQEWKLFRSIDSDHLTKEANKRDSWYVERQKAPYCDGNGIRRWFGQTPQAAFNTAIKATGLVAMQGEEGE